MIDHKLDCWNYHSNGVKTIVFVVTEDCQLACKYCYLVGKNSHNKLTLETAKRTIDYILDNHVFFNEDKVAFDFIGGEPFLEIELIDAICDYVKQQMFLKRHPWFDNYVFTISTNGINYNSEKVQNFIRKNNKHLQICITIDGTKDKHDLNRIYKNTGEGSYDDIVRNIPLWLSQFPNANTKVTLSSEDLPYVYDSVLHLFDLGIHRVYMNCVYEDVWQDGDDLILEEQLIKLADTIIENELYLDFYCSIFDDQIGKPRTDNHNWCGSGKMLAVDSKGNFYPCNRFLGFSLREKTPRYIGNIDTGIDTNKVRPFILLNADTQSTQECIKCEVATGCSWCQGENYDAADTDTIYKRSTAICKMHKARVRANNYYWNKLFVHIQNGGKEITNSSNEIKIC